MVAVLPGALAAAGVIGVPPAVLQDVDRAGSGERARRRARELAGHDRERERRAGRGRERRAAARAPACPRGVVVAPPERRGAGRPQAQRASSAGERRPGRIVRRRRGLRLRRRANRSAPTCRRSRPRPRARSRRAAAPSASGAAGCRPGAPSPPRPGRRPADRGRGPSRYKAPVSSVWTGARRAACTSARCP